MGAAARDAFGVVLIALGVVGVWRGDFVPPWEPVSADAPARDALVFATAVLTSACGVGLLFERAARWAARVLLAALAIWLVAFRIPHLVDAPARFDSWDGCAELATVIAATFAMSFADRGARFAHALLGVCLVCFGVGHFAYPDETASLVPSYLPLPDFMAFATGITFLMAAAFQLTGIAARATAYLAAAQIAGFTILVWIPIVVAGDAAAFAWSEFGLSALLATATAVVAAFGPTS